MKSIYYHLILGFVLCLASVSCEKSGSNSAVQIAFSNGIVVNENDIVFYDSSSCIFLLKDTLKFDISTGNPPEVQFVDFSVSVEDELIYTGILFPELVSMMPPNPTYIASYTYDEFRSNIIDVKFNNYFREEAFDDNRNNSRIIAYFEKEGKLCKGISITLDSVSLAANNDSTVLTTITIQNNDNVNYYLPNPNKLGVDYFNHLIGGLYIIDPETHIGYGPYFDYSAYPNIWGGSMMEAYSLLEARKKVSYTYNSVYSHGFEKGLYDCSFKFGNYNGHRIVTIPLERPDGWIWIGDKTISVEKLLI